MAQRVAGLRESGPVSQRTRGNGLGMLETPRPPRLPIEAFECDDNCDWPWRAVADDT